MHACKPLLLIRACGGSPQHKPQLKLIAGHTIHSDSIFGSDITDHQPSWVQKSIMRASMPGMDRKPPTAAHVKALRRRHSHSRCRRFAAPIRCSQQQGGAQRPLVVVGSINADLVLQVNRLPEAGETMEAGSLNYFPGGKVRPQHRQQYV